MTPQEVKGLVVATALQLYRTPRRHTAFTRRHKLRQVGRGSAAERSGAACPDGQGFEITVELAPIEFLVEPLRGEEALSLLEAEAEQLNPDDELAPRSGESADRQRAPGRGSTCRARHFIGRRFSDSHRHGEGDG